MTLVETQPAKAELAPTHILDIIASAAKDSAVDVVKLEKLMELHERVIAREAEGAFNAGMTKAQTDMRPIAADANNPQTRSKYASYAKLDRSLRPIYTRHGFGLSFDTGKDAPAGYVRVLCYVTHQDGGARTYHVDMPADGKGAKGGDVMTLTHATGAGLSYGMRYLLKMIFNVAVGEDDRDGNDPQEPRQVNDPAGFDSWMTDLSLVADEGTAALREAFKASKVEYRDHAMKHYREKIGTLKNKAEKVAQR